MIFEIPKDTEVLQIDITELKKQIIAEAIDDLVEGLKEYFIIPHDVRVIEMTAEQLKAGNK